MYFIVGKQLSKLFGQTLRTQPKLRLEIMDLMISFNSFEDGVGASKMSDMPKGDSASPDISSLLANRETFIDNLPSYCHTLVTKYSSAASLHTRFAELTLKHDTYQYAKSFKELLDLITEALTAAKPRDKVVFVLFYLEGLSRNNIGEIVNCAENHVTMGALPRVYEIIENLNINKAVV